MSSIDDLEEFNSIVGKDAIPTYHFWYGCLSNGKHDLVHVLKEEFGGGQMAGEVPVASVWANGDCHKVLNGIMIEISDGQAKRKNHDQDEPPLRAGRRSTTTSIAEVEPCPVPEQPIRGGRFTGRNSF